jgi:hypothetical protein
MFYELYKIILSHCDDVSKAKFSQCSKLLNIVYYESFDVTNRQVFIEICEYNNVRLFKMFNFEITTEILYYCRNSNNILSLLSLGGYDIILDNLGYIKDLLRLNNVNIMICLTKINNLHNTIFHNARHFSDSFRTLVLANNVTHQFSLITMFNTVHPYDYFYFRSIIKHSTYYSKDDLENILKNTRISIDDLYTVYQKSDHNMFLRFVYENDRIEIFKKIDDCSNDSLITYSKYHCENIIDYLKDILTLTDDEKLLLIKNSHIDNYATIIKWFKNEFFEDNFDFIIDNISTSNIRPLMFYFCETIFTSKLVKSKIINSCLIHDITCLIDSKILTYHDVINECIKSKNKNLLLDLAQYRQIFLKELIDFLIENCSHLR